MRTAWLAVLCGLGLVTLASMANALELRWASGQTNLQFEEARRCTLLLCASGSTTSLPKEWRLVYAVAGTDARIQFRLDYSEPGTAGVCWAPGEELTPGDRASRRQTVQHCSLHSTARAQCARYLFDLPAGARGTFRIVVEPANAARRSWLPGALAGSGLGRYQQH